MTLTTTGLDDLLTDIPHGRDVVVVRDNNRTIVAVDPVEIIRAEGEQALDALDAISGGWWAGFLSYDLGRAIERVSERNAANAHIPDLLLARFEERFVLEPDTDLGVPDDQPGAGLADWSTSIDLPAWSAAVERIHEHLLAGDCYQVNLTRQLISEVQADPVALYRALARHHPAPHAALIRLGDIGVVSASPERFLRRDGRSVETRPIKGTSPDAAALRASAKDRAENVMIVDLARNDFGRVCAYGSIHVPALCEVEAHPGLFHLVSTVRGTLRPDIGDGELVRATFPPASVTGCPKPRVMDIIESLEPVRRGVYCGAIGFIDADEDVLDLNVAIRTFTVTPDGTSFGVGGGIVADSEAQAEWDETVLKAAKLLEVAARP